MKVTNLFTKTSKTAPADETAKNAQLLIKAGFIHKELAGAYAFMPLGWRVIEKIKQIVREEMNATDSQELMMTVLQPKDIWEKTNRWDDKIVDNWFKTKLLNGAELGVGLTHEEPIVDSAKASISSHKDLPKSVYQIGTKFRNEKRAKSGLLRGREFIMKDAYTFAKDQAQHEQVYEQIAEAYHKIYRRLGIGDITIRVKADGGIFTEKYSDEFQTKSLIGEDTIFSVPKQNVYYNAEVAPAKAPLKTTNINNINKLSMQEINTPDIKGVEQLAKFLKVDITNTVKTMLYKADQTIIAVALRGDYEVNEIKLRKAVQAKSVELADEATIKSVTKAEVGYAGLLGLPKEVKIIADDSIELLVNFEMGANKTNYHNINVNWGIDLQRPALFYDVKQAKNGDINPETGEVYEVFKGVEVGNIFPLESKYTDALDLFYSDDQGKQQSIIMGCYGIGISRLMGVLAEQFSDDKGLVWPKNVAPYLVYIAQLGDNAIITKQAEDLYSNLQKAGVEVLWDDRPDARPGEKFADADLYGIPYRVVVSSKTVESGMYELKERTQKNPEFVSYDQMLALLAKQ